MRSIDDVTQWLDDLLIEEFHTAGIWLSGEREAMRNSSLRAQAFHQIILQQEIRQSSSILASLPGIGGAVKVIGSVIGGAIGGILSR